MLGRENTLTSVGAVKRADVDGAGWCTGVITGVGDLNTYIHVSGWLSVRPVDVRAVV